jgi:hypothetical protein
VGQQSFTGSFGLGPFADFHGVAGPRERAGGQVGGAILDRGP